MPKALMLDVDGVLVTGRPDDGRPWTSQIQQDLGIDPDQLARLFFAKYWPEIVVGQRDLRATLEKCLPGIVRDVSVDRFLSYWFEMDSRVDDAVLAQVASLRARAIPVFLATNQEHLRARFLMQEIGLSAHVDGIVYSAMEAATKPHRAFFRACEKRCGLPPGDLVLVDDAMANVTGALKAGWSAVHWTGSEVLADIVTAS